MTLRRIFQPRNPRFWLLVVLNTLSALLAWVLRTQPLPVGVMLLLAAVALVNAALGTWLMWVLWRENPPTSRTTPPVPTESNHAKKIQ